MKSYKRLINELPISEDCHLLTDEELHRLQRTMLKAYKDIEYGCKKHGIAIAMTGGNAIGAIRHKGFIPWDDDTDLMISRKDFEKLKSIFYNEFGDKYILNAPNYSEKPTNRFPKILIKRTKFVEMGMKDDDRACIKMDLFIVENIPESKIYQKIKGYFCNALMLIAGTVSTYEHRVPPRESRLAATPEGLKMYKRRVFIGRLFSFRNHYKWINSVDKHCQYKGKTGLVGTPTGSYHYFGTIMDRNKILPFIEVPYEDTTVNIPREYDAYLKQLYGDYMQIPPPEKQEHHYVSKIEFLDEDGVE